MYICSKSNKNIMDSQEVKLIKRSSTVNNLETMYYMAPQYTSQYIQFVKDNYYLLY